MGIQQNLSVLFLVAATWGLSPAAVASDRGTDSTCSFVLVDNTQNSPPQAAQNQERLPSRNWSFDESFDSQQFATMIHIPSEELARAAMTPGTPEYSYEGEKDQEGRPHGQGRCTYPNESYYEGRWVHGKKHGQGVVLSRGGLHICGTWVEDQPNGTVNWHKEDKDNADLDAIRYQGEVVNCIWPTVWIVRFGDGTVYEGDVADGKPHGKGKISYPNGNAYDGSWVEGKITGYGVGTWKEKNDTGSEYTVTWEGDWQNKTRNGAGLERHSDGFVMLGTWQDGILLKDKPLFHGLILADNDRDHASVMMIDGSKPICRDWPKPFSNLIRQYNAHHCHDAPTGATSLTATGTNDQ